MLLQWRLWRGVIVGLTLLVGMVVVSHKSNWLRRSTQGQLDSLTVAMKSDVFADPTRYARFCRSVSFHGLRYNREFMSIPNTNLMMVYDLLLLERPKASDLEPLRAVCTHFLQRDVTRDPPHYIDRSVGFFQESLADVILEELLDIYVQADRVAAQQQQQQRFETGCSEYAAEYGALGGPVLKEDSLSLYDHLGGGPKMLHDHFYKAIDEYLVGKRCVEPGSYAALSDTDPVYSELVLLTEFYQGGNRRPLTSMADAEYCVIDTEYSVIKTPDGDNRSDDGSPVYRLATARSSAIYEIANFEDSLYGGVYDDAGDGGSGGQHDAAVYGSVYDTAGGSQYRGSTVSGGVYDNKSRPGAEDRVNIVYETAEAWSELHTEKADLELVPSEFDRRFKTKPSNNNQLIADATIGELPAYEEPDYIEPETINMNEITSEAHFGSRSDALIPAIDDTVVIVPDQSTVAKEENVGVEPDCAGMRPMVLCGSSSSGLSFPACSCSQAQPRNTNVTRSILNFYFQSDFALCSYPSRRIRGYQRKFS